MTWCRSSLRRLKCAGQRKNDLACASRPYNHRSSFDSPNISDDNVIALSRAASIASLALIATDARDATTLLTLYARDAIDAPYASRHSPSAISYKLSFLPAICHTL